MARRKAIATGLIQQQTPTQLSKVLGVSRETIYQELRAPETQQLIRSWMEPHHAAIKRMIPRALAAVHKGMKPSQEMRDRLNAVKTLGTVMGWAEGNANDGDSDHSRNLKFSGQMESLLVLYRQVTTGEPPPDDPPAE